MCGYCSGLITHTLASLIGARTREVIVKPRSSTSVFSLPVDPAGTTTLSPGFIFLASSSSVPSGILNGVDRFFLLSIWSGYVFDSRSVRFCFSRIGHRERSLSRRLEAASARSSCAPVVRPPWLRIKIAVQPPAITHELTVAKVQAWLETNVGNHHESRPRRSR